MIYLKKEAGPECGGQTKVSKQILAIKVYWVEVCLQFMKWSYF